MSERIKCIECGEYFKTLTTHLLKAHNLKSREYMNKYPGATLVSDTHREKQRATTKARIKSDPIKWSAIVSSRKFDFVKNKELQLLLQRDYKSAKRCLQYQLWKPAIIFYSSLIEAILREKTRKAGFSEALETAFKNGNILKEEYHQIYIVKDMRNFIHLHKELAAKIEPSDYWAKTIADICESIINRFRTSEQTKQD